MTQEQLIQKYNSPAPRYTSYPPANFFGPITRDEYLEAINQSNRILGQNNISFYIHIPFCRRLCHYCACNAYPMQRPDDVKAYVDAIHREIEMLSTLIDKGRKISQIHFGGGSPTAIPLDQIKSILTHLLERYPTIDKPEIAIECHPGYLDADQWQSLIEMPFNRFSIGVQDLNAEILKTVNRKPALLPIAEIVNMIQNQDKHVNIDLLYGLPGQTAQSFETTAREIATYHPQRIVTFGYGHVPWVHKRQLILEKAGLPDPQERQKMFDSAKNTLIQNGYEPIGMDHFVLPEDELAQAVKKNTIHRNFQGYCTKLTTAQVYALGVTGISQLEGAYLQNGSDIKQYILSMQQAKPYLQKGIILTQKQIITKNIVENIMCNYRCNWEEMAIKLGVSTQEVKQAVTLDIPLLTQMQQDGILSLDDDGLIVTTEAKPLVRNVVAAIDPILPNAKQKFSKPI